jgi:hypothetical protein
MFVVKGGNPLALCSDWAQMQQVAVKCTIATAQHLMS